MAPVGAVLRQRRKGASAFPGCGQGYAQLYRRQAMHRAAVPTNMQARRRADVGIGRQERASGTGRSIWRNLSTARANAPESRSCGGAGVKAGVPIARPARPGCLSFRPCQGSFTGLSGDKTGALKRPVAARSLRMKGNLTYETRCACFGPCRSAASVPWATAKSLSTSG